MHKNANLMQIYTQKIKSIHFSRINFNFVPQYLRLKAEMYHILQHSDCLKPKGQLSTTTAGSRRALFGTGGQEFPEASGVSKRQSISEKVTCSGMQRGSEHSRGSSGSSVSGPDKEVCVTGFNSI